MDECNGGPVRLAGRNGDGACLPAIPIVALGFGDKFRVPSRTVSSDMQRNVIYDCDRLVSVLKKNTPTGIDRVDFRYLSHFFDDPDTTLVGLHQRNGEIGALGREEICEILSLLDAKWSGDGDAGPEARPKAEALRKDLRRHDIGKLLRSHMAPGAMFRREVSGHLGETLPAFYFNASHRNLLSPRSVRSMKRALGCKAIYFIHDLIPMDFPEFVRAGHDRKHARRMAVAADYADLLVFNSAYSQDRFAHHMAANHTPLPQSTVIHIGVEERFTEHRRAEVGHGDPYFLVIGTLEPRKNLRLVLRAWERLLEAGNAVPELRIVGRLGWTTDANQTEIDMIERLSECVTHLEGLSDADLMDQIAGARALLFPSLVEGWGMPLVEAATMGVPVIASDIPAFREASQGCAELLDPHDVEAWATAVAQHYDPDGDAARRARDRLSDFRPPLWRDHFATFEDGFRSAFR